MQTKETGSQLHSLLSQAKNNTTLWIGHLQADPNDHFAGQTFTCTSEGRLDNIQLFAETVQRPCDIQLSLHEFDNGSKTWGPAIGESNLEVEKSDQQQWIRFPLPALHLKKEATYGFRVHTDNGMVGLGEAVTSNQSPFTFGYEWNGDSDNDLGRYYSFFSLAFKIYMRA